MSRQGDAVPARVAGVGQRTVVAVLCVAAVFVNIMDTTVVNVALPSIAREFDLPHALTEAPVISYLVSLSVVMPVAHWAAGRFGLKAVFAFAVALFTVASALCASAWSIESLTAFRLLQGVGGGLLSPVAMTMLLTTFQAAERIRVGRLLMLPTTAAPATGPLVGGLLVDHADWRWVFLINLPLGVLAVLGVWLYLQPFPPEPAQRLDGTGFVLGGGGLAGLVLGLSALATQPWHSPVVWLPLTAGVVSFTAFSAWERRTTTPLLDLSLLRERLFITCAGTQTLSLAAFFGFLYLLPLGLQGFMGLSALQSGLCTATEAVGVLSGTQFVAWLYPRVGPRPLLVVGSLGITASGLGLIAVLDQPPWAVAGAMFAAGVSMSFIFLSAETAAFTRTASVGSASVVFNVLMQAGSALGVAAAALGLSGHGTLPGPSEVQHGLSISIALGALAVVVAVCVDNRAAAPTMHRIVGRAAPTSQDAAGRSAVQERGVSGATPPAS